MVKLRAGLNMGRQQHFLLVAKARQLREHTRHSMPHIDLTQTNYKQPW